jgi:hypothetical protein
MHANEVAVGAVVLLDEARRPPQALAPRLFVPLPHDAAPIACEPPPRAERQPFVDTDPEAFGALRDGLAVPADVEDGGHAAAQQLRHREIDARERALCVLRAVAHRQVFEEPRIPELRAAAVLDERAVERRAAEVRVRADESGGEHTVARIDRLVHVSVEARADVEDGFALDDDHAVAQQPVLLAVERDDPPGANRRAAGGGAHGPRSVPSSRR